jgi:hypothetical protein
MQANRTESSFHLIFFFTFALTFPYGQQAPANYSFKHQHAGQLNHGTKSNRIVVLHHCTPHLHPYASSAFLFLRHSHPALRLCLRRHAHRAAGGRDWPACSSPPAARDARRQVHHAHVRQALPTLHYCHTLLMCIALPCCTTSLTTPHFVTLCSGTPSARSTSSSY